MAISAQCPHCFAKLKLKNPDLVGKKVRCPSCEEPFRVEAPADSPELVAATGKRAQPKETAAEDDWLGDLNSYRDVPAESSVTAPPPIVGRKKKKVPADSEAKPRRRRDDEDEGLSLTAHRILMMVTGVVGGLIGVAIWGGIIYGTGYEVGYVAILVGFLAGTGVRLGASNWDYGWWPAVTAVVIAATTIIAGKLVGINLLVRSMFGGGVSIGLSQAGLLFSPIDLLWFALACSGAFKIAAGWDDDD